MKQYKRLLAMGDIHGQYELMCEVLDKAKYNPEEDKLVLLGDYIDRGRDSKLVVDKVRELVKGGATALMGNHELMMIRAIKSKDDIFDTYISEDYRLWAKGNGGNKTIKSFKNSLLEMRKAIRLFMNMPTYYEAEGFVFAHGAVNNKLQDGMYIPLVEQKQEWFVWDRHVDNPKVRYNSKVVVVGHTPVQLINNNHSVCDPIIEYHAIYLDTGAVWSGENIAALTIMDVLTKEYWQACKLTK